VGIARIANILSIFKTERRGAKVTDIKSDPGGGANVTAEKFEPAGDDSQPLTSDQELLVSIKRSGGEVAIGFLDPKNEQKSEPGEKRIYSRGEDGVQVCELFLHGDGSATLENENGAFTLGADGSHKLENAAGSFELQAGGNIIENTVLIDVDGNITTTGTITAGVINAPVAGLGAVTVTTISIGGVNLKSAHTHAYSWTDPAGSGNTGAPNP
jgi:hypothetical protein